jgi:hypothetical protein
MGKNLIIWKNKVEYPLQLILWGRGPGVSTQGLRFPRQAIYHLSQVPGPPLQILYYNKFKLYQIFKIKIEIMIYGHITVRDFPNLKVP